MTDVALRPDKHAFFKRLGLSHAFLLAYPIFISLAGRSREMSDAYDVDTSALVQIGYVALMGLYALSVVLGGRGGTVKLLFSRPLLWFTAYLLLGVASAAWSTNSAFTIYRACEALVYLVVVTVAVSRFEDMRDAVRFQVLYGFIIVLVWHFGNLRFGLSWEMLHNGLATGTNIGVIFFWSIIQGHVWGAMFLAMMFSILVGTSSASYLGLLTGLGCLLLLGKGVRRVAGVLLAVGIALVIWGWGLDFGNLLFWGKSEGAVLTATGRFPVWRLILDNFIAQKPILGYAFGIGETIARVSEEWTGFRMQHMHNSVLSALVNLGSVGLLLFVLFISDLFLNIIKHRSAPAAHFAIAACGAVLMNSFAMPSVTAPVTLAWIGHMLLYLNLAIFAGRYAAASAATQVSAPPVEAGGET